MLCWKALKEAKKTVKKSLLFVVLICIWVAILGFIYLDNSQDHTAKAEKTLNKFMIARLQNNQQEAEDFLTDNARKQYDEPGLTLIGGPNPHFIKYKIIDIVTEGNRGDWKITFVVRIFEDLTGDQETNGYFDETLTVREVDKQYKIESVKRSEYVHL